MIIWGDTYTNMTQTDKVLFVNGPHKFVIAFKLFY